MTRPISILIVAVVVPLLSGVIYLGVPVLRSPEAAVNLEANEHVEAARRLLFQYGGNEERLAQVLRQLESHGVDVGMSGDEAERILDENREAVDEVEELLREQTGGRTTARIREIEERYQAAGGTNASAVLPTGGFGGGTGAVLRTVRDGIRTRDSILAQNAKLLNESLGRVNQALAVSRGDVSASQHQYANTLKGIILVAKATAAQREARRARATADASRQALVTLSGRIKRLAIDQELVERSEVDDRLDTLSEESRRLAREAETSREKIAALGATIAGLETRLDEARRRAHTARDEMGGLEEEGVDLLDPSGSEEFADTYTRLSVDYGRALSDIQRLERGTLLNARIDDSGDYVHGRFVPEDLGGEITEQRGWTDYRNDRETLARDLEGIDATLAIIEEGIEELSTSKTGYRERAAAAKSEAVAARARAAELFAQFSERVDAADAAVEEAVTMARQAVRAFRVAGGAAGTRGQDARGKLEPLSPAAKERSPFKLVSEDRWQTGQLDNASAQAEYVAAAILYDRFAAAAVDFPFVTQAKADLEIADADPGVLAERRDGARDEAVESARAAVEGYEKSFAGLNNNWTVPAAAAAAHDLLSVLEDPAHVTTAIANYEHAVANRESEAVVQPLVERLETLRNR